MGYESGEWYSLDNIDREKNFRYDKQWFEILHPMASSGFKAMSFINWFFLAPGQYASFPRPNPEHCVQAWSPHLVKDIDNLEKVQHRATKLFPGIDCHPFEQ